MTNIIKNKICEICKCIPTSVFAKFQSESCVLKWPEHDIYLEECSRCEKDACVNCLPHVGVSSAFGDDFPYYLCMDCHNKEKMPKKQKSAQLNY